MKNALVPLADGFEDIEAVAIIDVLRRGGVEVVTAALGPKRTALSAHGISMETDALLMDVLEERWDAIVLPGGGGGTAGVAGEFGAGGSGLGLAGAAGAVCGRHGRIS